MCVLLSSSLLEDCCISCVLRDTMASQRAVGYVRTSSLTNIGYNKDSIPRQQAAINDCAATMGLTVAKIFDDPGVSGTDEVQLRPGFRQMIDFCTSEDIHTITFEDAGRFARDLMCQEIAYKHLTEAGFRLVSAASPQQFLEQTLTAKLVRQVLGSVAEFVKSDLVARLRVARDRSAVKADRQCLKGNLKSVGRTSKLFGAQSLAIADILKGYAEKENLGRGDLAEARKALHAKGISTSGGRVVATRIAASWIRKLRDTTNGSKSLKLTGKQAVRRRPARATPAATRPTVVPVDIQDAIKAVPDGGWSRSTAAYRVCKSLHFGLGVPCNNYVTKGSVKFAALETLLLAFVRKFDVDFTSIVVNRYKVGDEMGEHRDRNMAGHTVQMVGVFGDFEGGVLLVRHPSGEVQTLGPGAHLMESSSPHWVDRVTKGVRFSIVSYAKDVSCVPSTLTEDLQNRSFRFQR